MNLTNDEKKIILASLGSIEIKPNQQKRGVLDIVTIIEKLKESIEPEPVEIEGGDWYFSSRAVSLGVSETATKEHGVEYPNEESCKAAYRLARRNNRYNRFALQYGAEIEVDWGDKSFNKYYCYYDHEMKKYKGDTARVYQSASRFYFTNKEKFEKFLADLNNGSIKL